MYLTDYKWRIYYGQAVVAHAFNPSTQEAETSGFLWVWSQPGLQDLVPGQLGLLYRETLYQTNKKTKKEDLLWSDFQCILKDLELIQQQQNSFLA